MMTSTTAQLQRNQIRQEKQTATSRPGLVTELAVFASIFAAACFIFFTGLGDFPLFNPDEAFYAEPAREMLDTGDYITTTLNYAIRYTKPPLHIWLVAFSYHLFGQNEFAARFVSATCGALLVACTYWMLNRTVGMRAGLIGAGALMSAPLYVVSGRLAIGDMTLSLATVTGLFSFFNAFREKRQSLVFLGYLLLALAVMTKGPVGIVLPAIILFGYHLLRRNLIEALKFYKPHLGALLVAAVTLPWLVIETMVTKGEYFTCFIVMENFQRFLKVVSGHKGAWWYHIAAVAGGFAPWTIFLPQALVGAFRIERTSSQNQKSDSTGILNTFRHLDTRQELALFAACLLILTVAFYSASVSKLMSYTLPAFPALAILVAIELDRTICQRQFKRLMIPLALCATVYGVGSLIEPLVITHVRRVPPTISLIVENYLIAGSIGLAIAVAFLAVRRWNLAVSAFALTAIGAGAFFGFQAAHVMSDFKERGVADLARFAANSDEPIFVYKARLPSATFYTHRATVGSPAQEKPIAGTNRFTGVAGQSQPPIPFWVKETSEPQPTEIPVEEQILNSPRAYVLCSANDATVFDSHPGAKRVAQDGKFVLIHWLKPADQSHP